MSPSRRQRNVSAAALTLLAAAALSAAQTPPAVAGTAGVVLHTTVTTSDLTHALTQGADVKLGAVASGTANVTVDDTQTSQTMDGFGAAFTDSAAYTLAGLPAAARKTAMIHLFSPSSGIGLSFMRTPMGASDYSATPATSARAYSYDDNNGDPDPSLAHFSVAHDQTYVIPIIKQAQQLNPNMLLYANNWSPPGWMKTNNSMITVNGDAGTLLSDDYAVLGQYYVKYLQAYAAAGVKVWGITPQNEPSVTPGGYAGMNLTAPQEAKLITSLSTGANLGGTKILGIDDNPNIGYANTVLSDADANAALYGTAYHCYGNNIGDIATINAAHPTRSYISECSPPPGIAPMTTAQLIIEATNSGVSGVDTWNLALNPGGGPKMGAGCTNCDGLVSVNPDGSVHYNLGYYQMGQFSRFVQRGATHIATTDPGGSGGPQVSATAYRNPDGSEVLVATNNESTPQTFTTTWNGQGSFAYTLPAGATVTFSTAKLPALSFANGAPGVLYTHAGTGQNQWQFSDGDWGDGDGNKYSNHAGATATFRFAGAGVTVYAFPNALNGLVDFAVDGGAPTRIDLSLDPSRTPKAVYTTAGLDPTVPHTLVETVVGQRGVGNQDQYGSVISAVASGDTAPPVLSVAVSAVKAPVRGWYPAPVTVTASAVDGGDASPSLQVRVDNAPDWSPLTGPLVLGDGTHTVALRAVDASGNVSDVVTRAVSVDQTAPVTRAAVNPSARTITLTATDATSGVNRVQYKLSKTGGVYLTAAGQPIPLGSGPVTVSYRALDNAGNQEVTHVISLGAATGT